MAWLFDRILHTRQEARWEWEWEWEWDVKALCGREGMRMPGGGGVLGVSAEGEKAL